MRFLHKAFYGFLTKKTKNLNIFRILFLKKIYSVYRAIEYYILSHFLYAKLYFYKHISQCHNNFHKTHFFNTLIKRVILMLGKYFNSCILDSLLLAYLLVFSMLLAFNTY